MEDDNIRNLFNDFQPELSSSFQFMSKLKKNMEILEILKHREIALKKRNKLAVVIAAVSGFVMGIILSLLLPLIGNWVATFRVSLPHIQSSSLTIDYSPLAWIVMAGVCIITALNTYEIALAKLTPKKTDPL